MLAEVSHQLPQDVEAESLNLLCMEESNKSSQQHVDTSLLAALPVAFVMLDSKGVVENANKLAVDLLGHALIGFSWRAVLHEILDQTAAHGHTVRLTNAKIVQVDMSPIPNRKGQLITFSDLTHTHHLQNQIAHLQKLSALGEMVAKLAHQIRTPLSAALLYSENLAMVCKDERGMRFTHNLQARLKELEAQVNDMLLFAKSDTQGVTVETSLADLLNEVAAHCEGVTTKYQCELVMQNKVSPAQLVRINHVAILGAIGNLIHNAAQVSPANSTIKLVCSENNTQIIVDVIDAGPGIPKDQRAHIFTPFFTTKTHGTGLGLAVVRSVMQAHAGSIQLLPSEVGAHFRCTLPKLAQNDLVII